MLRYPWDHPLVPQVPERIRLELGHAQRFSETIYGAAILYNLLLAEASKWQEGIDAYRESFAEWGQMINARISRSRLLGFERILVNSDAPTPSDPDSRRSTSSTAGSRW